jgi:two-component system NarL family sensor kinase
MTRQKNLTLPGLFACLFMMGAWLNGTSQERADSLLKALAAAADTAKVRLLNELAAEYHNKDKEKTLAYAEQAHELALRLKDRPGEARALSSLGVIVQKNGNYDSALAIQFRALKIYEALKDEKGIATAYGNISAPYWRLSQFSTALDYQLKALKLQEKNGDLKGQAYSLNMIGIIYKNLKKDREALAYYLRSVEIKKQIGDEKTLASTYMNIANVYKNRLVEDTATAYYEKAIELHRRLGNKSGESMSVSGLGDLKVKFGRYAEAKKYYLRSLEIEQAFLDSNSLATTYINIGNACTALKEYKDAEHYIKGGLDIFYKIGDQDGVMSACEMLAFLYQETGDYRQSMDYYIEYIAIRDSIMGVEEKSRVAELQTRYEVEKKDLELARNKAELEAREKEVALRNIQLVSVFVLIILLALLAYLFYNRKRIQQQARLSAEIARQREIRTKAVIEAEEKERIRIAKDLHDGVGQLLSATKLNLDSVRSTMNISGTAQESAFKNALDLLDESVKEVRAVSHNMMPNTLLKLGLASAVREFITKIQNMPDLRVSLEIVGMTERLEQEKESILYRVIQEVVSNIIKHARATELNLQLIRHEKELTILIEDNGVGFDTNRINDFEGIGLKNIVSRVEFINGSVHFDSTPGRGTSVVVEIKL